MSNETLYELIEELLRMTEGTPLQELIKKDLMGHCYALKGILASGSLAQKCYEIFNQHNITAIEQCKALLREAQAT